MLKKISLAVLGLTIATLGARIVAWVTGDPRAPITSGKQIILIAIFFFVLVALTWVVETKALISFNWPWHRRRYFHEISKVGTLGAERILKDPDQSEDELLIEVMQDGKRQNLVNLLHERLKPRDKPRRILILGEAGSGKSTALKQLRLRMIRDGTKLFGIGKPIPILAPLGRYSQTRLLDYTREIFDKESRKLSAVMEKLLQEGRMVLLLDALDEALGSNAVREINDLLSSPDYQNLAVVITGRRGEYEKDLPADMEIFSVEELSDEAVLTLSRTAIAAQNLSQAPSEIFSSLEQNQLLSEGGLGRNPFWLDLILKGETFSNSKTEIFASALKALFDREWNRIGSKRLWVAALPQDEQFLHTKKSLAELALQISTGQQNEQIDGEEALKVIEKYLSKQTRIEKLRPQDILWLSRDELLVNFDDLADKDRWPPVRFRHRLIREYLTALELSSDPQSVQTVFGQYAADVNWWETLLMLKTLAAAEFDFKKRQELVEAAIAKTRDPHRLFFAWAMLEYVDFIGAGIHTQVTDALVAELRQGVTSNYAAAAVSLINVAPQTLVHFIKESLDRNDPLLTPNVKQLLKEILQQQASDKGSSKIFAYFLGDPYLHEVINPILAELGSIVTLRVTGVLGDSNFGVRWRAAEVLGEIGDTRAVEPLIGLLADEEETVVSTAIESLGKLRDVRALEPIARMFGTEDESLSNFALRATIIKSLGNFGPAAIDELIRMLKSDDVTVWVFAFESLKQIGRAASPALIELLNYRSTWTRKNAIELLGEFRETEAIEPLIRLLDCPDIFAKDEAVKSLALIGKPAAEPLHAAMLTAKREIRKSAAIVLGQIADKRALEPLITILKDRSEGIFTRKKADKAGLRADVAEALAVLGDVAAVEPLRDAVKNDPRTIVAVAAMASLVRLGDDDQLDVLHTLLKSDDPAVQFSVIQALGRVKSPKSLSYLEKFWKTHAPKDAATATDKRRSDEANRALRSINKSLEALVGPPDPSPKRDLFDDTPPPRDLRSYAKVLKLPDKSVRREAAKALAEIGAEAVDLLLVALNDEDADVRIPAAVGLGTFGGGRALEPLLEILKKDPKNTVRMAAAESLGKLGLPGAIGPLKEALDDEYLLVNIGAAIGLHELGEPGMVEALDSTLQKNKAPGLRYQNARAYLLLEDVNAIPYLEKSLKEWQDEGVAPEDRAHFERASTILAKLRAM
jgi:HEAT repeat protein